MNQGVLLVFFLFSAPSGNQNTAAGYNTDILEKMLEQWRQSLGSRDREKFEVWVAITDTDLIERGALLCVFPNVVLLICRFHFQQSWKNHRNKSLKGASSNYCNLKARLCRVEDLLIETEDLTRAKSIVTDERMVIFALQGTGECDEGAAESVLGHLNYLNIYWLREALWVSWSKAGQLRLAMCLKRPVNGIVPTTNHLESFNGVLKRKHLRRWQNNGQRLRLDVLVHVLVLYALPSIFQQQCLKDSKTARQEALLRQLPGGAAIVDSRSCSLVPFVPAAYWATNNKRDLAAAELVGNHQIGAPTLDDEGNYSFECYLALATDFNLFPVKYTIIFCLGKMVTCTCRDFSVQGCVCKHIRAAVVQTQLLRMQGISIHLPPTEPPSRAMNPPATPPLCQTRADYPITGLPRELRAQKQQKSYGIH
ncbi:hypothetical protein BC835DRAFT_1311092 [Cytidiella melzeri]|nr:hypothetical protein BC835DRAFT_1311092 [Cytidiella melzeri]